MKNSTIVLIVLVVALVIITAGAVFFFGNNGSTTTTTTTTTTTGKPDAPQYESMDFFKEDVSKFVTLGQYTGLEVEVDQLEISQEEIDMQIHILLCQKQEFTKVREGIVTEKAIFNFNYTGYLLKEDGSLGEKFSGGSATDQFAFIDGEDFITVSSNGTGQFIDGFAQGIIGKTIGDTFNINVTFPKDYGSAELAGKEVVFEITLNYNAQTNFTDAWVKSFSEGKYKTTEEFVQYIKDSVNPGIEDSNVELIWEKIVENAQVIEIPKQQFDFIYNALVDEVNSYVQYSQYYFGAVLNYQQVLEKLGFANDDELKKYAEDMILADLVRYAVIQAEGITCSDEEYRIFMDSLIESTGKTEEDILKQYDEEYLRQQVVFQNLQTFIKENNTFVLKPQTDAE